MISCREIGIHSLQGFESSHLRSNYSWSKDTNHTDKAEEQMVLHFYIARMLRVWYLIQHALTLRWKTSKWHKRGPKVFAKTQGVTPTAGNHSTVMFPSISQKIGYCL